MQWYRKDVEDLSADDCWELLRADGVGRLAVVVDGEPDVFPVNYVVDRATIVFRPGHELLEALQLPLFPWQEGVKDQFVRIVPATVTGRRFTMAPREAWNSPLSPELRTPTGSIRWVEQDSDQD